MAEKSCDYIEHIEMRDSHVIRRTPLIEAEREAAMFNILNGASFRPKKSENGPYAIHIGIEAFNIIFIVLDKDQSEVDQIALSVKAMRQVVKDYFFMCESLMNAANDHLSIEKIEAIDMARRSIHNEGAVLLKDRLGEVIDMDIDTARGLFTLVSILFI